VRRDVQVRPVALDQILAVILDNDHRWAVGDVDKSDPGKDWQAVVTGVQAQELLVASLQAASAHKGCVFHFAPPRE
jgi:hypothetical protein